MAEFSLIIFNVAIVSAIVKIYLIINAANDENVMVWHGANANVLMINN